MWALPTAALRITLNTPTRLAELLAHLRAQGCIAYLDEEARCVHAVAPSGNVRQDDAGVLSSIVGRWASERELTFLLRD